MPLIKLKKNVVNLLAHLSFKEIINIIEQFLKDNKFICYGGTAINNILPMSMTNSTIKTSEIPDYDFFSPNALNDAKKLADIYYNAGFDEVEAKAGVHFGTYKVYVNFIPIADITQLDSKLYNALKKEVIIKQGIQLRSTKLFKNGCLFRII